MKTLSYALASLLFGSTLAAADPDFTMSAPPPPAHPAQAASVGASPIEPTTLVSFANDSYQLDSAGVSEINDIAAWMKAHPNENVVVQGYTDRTGSHAYNVGLAKRRAEAKHQRIEQADVDAPPRGFVASVNKKPRGRLPAGQVSGIRVNAGGSPHVRIVAT